MVQGVCPVLETPFSADGSIDESSFIRLVDHMVRSGVQSVMFPGFASEFHKLTDEERLHLTRILLQRTAGVPGFTTVISIPDHATAIAVDRAREAVAGGAGAINVLPPHFLGPSRPAVHAHLRSVIAAVAPIPVIVQFAPAQTGTALDAKALSALAEEAPNLVQVKVESTPPGTLISALASSDPSLGSLVGYAGVQLPDALRRGADGVQPGCSFVELYLDIWRLWHDGQHLKAEELHRRLLPYVSYWMQSVELIIAAEKEISVRRGMIDSAFCRGPGHGLDAFELAMISDFMNEFGDRLRDGVNTSFGNR
ncbi:dihydrodipicolinate synthase family protein [Saxibacter everestensis]|uniref:Dihydrodipicolinate synthase family protein n=1 Tax=Saxibacter everestensis TaxID=2909229 RepID=A0ABY8QYT1_9MICO|nr:dihydrodipicolinate synthase family protein [Brevibacteriaceae bacterium ZFBP1038]